MGTVLDRLTAALADRYRIERELGAGGMATVYLAEDLKHDRKVALKVLKPELAAVLGAERFVVEIKTTAALQHPHILPLFDSGTADGFLFYVMPFIDGETLRDKLNRETQLGVDEAVRITREVADALHYAHANGVIHRDIKPENILLQGGRPMVADFGIALAVSAAAGGRMTETGLSLGTPHYMSPEQATAEKEITGRSDVYSLASVCYEMLTGNPPHVGSSAQQIIMKIITEQPQAVTTHRKAVPPYVAAAVSKALEKLPADRFETAEKFAEALANPSFTTASATGTEGVPGRIAAPRQLGVAVAATAVLSAALTFGLTRSAPPEQPVTRYLLALPDSQMPVAGNANATVPAPDGSFLVYRGPLPGEPSSYQLWIKRRDAAAATPILGTRGAGLVSISPDGTRLAFDYGSTLRVLPVTGGTPVAVASGAVQSLGLTWLDDQHVAFTAPSDSIRAQLDLWVVAVEGGTPRALGVSDLQRSAVFPQPVHGRDAVLFQACLSPRDCELRVHDLRDGSTKTLVPASVFGSHAASGHLIFERAGSLVAARFDARSLEIVGETIVLSDQIALTTAGTAIALSRDGTLTAVLGGGRLDGLPQQLVWVDRNGREELVDPGMPPIRMTLSGANHGWALSPDGMQLAIGLYTETGDDIWVKRLPRGALTRVSFDPGTEYRPRWTPNGRSLAYVTPQDLRLRRADGTGSDSVLVDWPVNELRFSPDGEWLVARAGAAGSVTGGRDILIMRLGVDSLPRPLLAAPNFDETAPAISPDGRWLLYQSNESGRREIYLRPFPDVDRLRLQVSVGGGEAPLWSRNGREIFFMSIDRQMMAVDFASGAAGAAPTVTAPRALFPIPAALLGVESEFMAPWDIAADGRFLMSRILDADADRPVAHLITHNLFTELRARLP